MAEGKPDLVGTTLGKKFLVRRLIGEGGMGAVYEVEHVFTKRVGALKLLHKSFASVPDVVERFVREASAAGRIENPHIVETIDAGELETGEPYMFMELLSGSPVSELIQRRRQLRFDEALEIVIQSAQALAAAHAVDIVHRDIKPENLFVCQGDQAFVKLLDFGISKFAPHHTGDHRLTSEGTQMGTPYYMSPEQVVGRRDVDARTDIYSLGVVLYECVAGRVPFDAETLPALSVLIHQGKYTPLSQLRPDTPESFDSVLAKAIAVDPKDRYQTMQSFGEALLGLTKHQALSFAPTMAHVPGQDLQKPVASSTALLKPESDTQAPPDGPPPTAPRRAYWAVAAGIIIFGTLTAWFVESRREGSQAFDNSLGDTETPASDRAKEAKSPPAGKGDLPRARADLLQGPAPNSSLDVRPAAAAATRAHTSAAIPTASARAAPAAAAPPPGSGEPSRAALDGLSEENPFSQGESEGPD